MEEGLIGEIVDEYSFVADFIDAYGYLTVLGFLIFIIIAIVSEVIAWIFSRIASRTEGNKSQIYRLFSKVVRAFGLIIAITSGLGTLGVNISALVAGLGLTGFALGFALKDALSNTLAGMLIILYKPFDLNDEIEIMGSSGFVKEVNLRYIILESQESEVILPNSSCFTQKIIKKKKSSEVSKETAA